MALAADGGSKGYFSRIGVCNLVFYVENHRGLTEQLLVELDAFADERIYEGVLELDENGMN